MAGVGIRAALAVVAAGALALAGCGDDAILGTGTGADTLTIYSSLPLQGPWRDEAQSIVNGEKLALEQAGGMVGRFTVKYVSLDDSSSAKRGWDPGVTITNARQAVSDKSTIAYLGDFDTGATAISLPLLNSASILQITPSSSANGLTSEDGADKGEPEKYYPSGTRTFGRVVPTDDHQAAAQVELLREDGCERLYVIDDRDVYGHGIAALVAREADSEGITVVGSRSIDRKHDRFDDAAADVAKASPDCVFFGGTVEDPTPALWEALHRALPSARLYGADGLAGAGFAAQLSDGAAQRTRLTTYAADPSAYRGGLERFAARYRARYQEEPTAVAVYGYEAMGLALQAIRDAGAKGNDRAAVIRAFYRIHDRDSILGRYSIDARGDTSLAGYRAVTIRHGRLRWGAVIGAGA
jgi:branched-chain amino acid transport system substrate-binding protein